LNFDKGAKDEFFKAWNLLVPSHMIKQDFRTKKLEFYLRIYFVVFVQHPYN